MRYVIFLWHREWNEKRCCYVGPMRRKKIVVSREDSEFILPVMDAGLFDEEMLSLIDAS